MTSITAHNEGHQLSRAIWPGSNQHAQADGIEDVNQQGMMDGKAPDSMAMEGADQSSIPNGSTLDGNAPDGSTPAGSTPKGSSLNESALD